MLPDASCFIYTQPLTPQFHLKDATEKTALWITSGQLARAHGCARTYPCQQRNLGGPSVSPPRHTTPITRRCSQRQQLDHSCAFPGACLVVSETNVIAIVAMVTLHLPVCLRTEKREWKRRWRQAERSGSVSFTLCVCKRRQRWVGLGWVWGGGGRGSVVEPGERVVQEKYGSSDTNVWLSVIKISKNRWIIA